MLTADVVGDASNNLANFTGYNLLILPGQTDISTNIIETFDVYRTVTTTTTNTLTRTYDIVGTPRANSPAVPEPSPLALLALGLLPVGIVMRKRIAA